MAYGIVGNDVEGFLPDSLPENALKQAVGVFITFHILVIYVVAGQPLHKFVAVSLGRCVSAAYWARWLMSTSFFLLFSWVIANSIPFFADLQGATARPRCTPRPCHVLTPRGGP